MNFLNSYFYKLIKLLHFSLNSDLEICNFARYDLARCDLGSYDFRKL